MLSLKAALQNGPNDSLSLKLTLSVSGQVTHQVEFPFSCPSDDQTMEDLRWLLEEFLDDRSTAGQIRAARVRKRIIDLGYELFHAVFGSTAEAKALWTEMDGQIQEARVEVYSPPGLTALVPWELMRIPGRSIPLCLAANSFVRLSHPEETTFGVRGTDRIRLLLITSRPSGIADVSYRQIALKIFESLCKNSGFEVTFLRPPTFSHCARLLRRAKSAARPFDVVHFDGHGFHLDSRSSLAATPGAYIYFEDESGQGDRAVSSREFANLASEANVAAVVLNACRSAYANTSRAPTNDEEIQPNVVTSFSQDLISSGVRVVVAMKYNVYVASALHFVCELYGQIGRGQPIVSAASLARKDLATDVRRSDGFDALQIEDWIVPVVFQAGDDLAISVSAKPDVTVAEGRTAADLKVSNRLPPPPDLGFVGADDSILAMDRAFDKGSVVLVHGLAGSGKTATSIEFGRWYFLTGGFSGQLLFTSFEAEVSLDQILAEVEPIMLRRIGQDWSTLGLADRANLASGLLGSESIFWIWDGIETLRVAHERKHRDLIINFLRRSASGGVKFLLTSRAQETSTLGYLPIRLEMLPLRFTESVEFTRRMTFRIGRSDVDLSLLWPILLYCDGNPLTLSIALATFLARGIEPTTIRVERFVEELRSGEADLDDDEAMGPSRSLVASLQIGFDALPHQVLRRLSLLYLFRSYVNINVILVMCRPIKSNVIADPQYDYSWSLHEFSEDSPPELEKMLRKASEVGLLRRSAEQHYWLHPAIQSHLRRSFRRFFPEQKGFERCARAFAEGLGVFAIGFTLVHMHGVQEKVIKALKDEEANLRHAFALSRQFQWPQAQVSLLHGLFTLYWHTGRRVEWASLLDQMLPDFIDDQGSPHVGRERWWTFMMDQAIRLAMWRRTFKNAESLARSVLRVEREAASVVVVVGAPLSERARKQMQSFAIALARLADILLELGDPRCLEVNIEAHAIYKSIDDQLGISIRLFNLGHVFKNLPSLRDLDKAERYYAQAYESYPDHDTVSRNQCLAQLGSVQIQRLADELAGDGRPEVLASYFDDALERYVNVLDNTDPNDVLALADVHNQLGVVYQYLSDGADSAFEHFRLAIQYFDIAMETFKAASARNNAAQVLDRLGRFDEALTFAKEALTFFSVCSPESEVTNHLWNLVAELERKQPSGEFPH